MPRQKCVDGVYSDLTAEEEAALDAMSDAADLDLNMVRNERNALLSGSDWTQVADVALSAEKVAEWATYRQELRDYPAQSDRQSTLPDWPTPPE
jgi:hypothetical protein